ncbi:hypothetical protein [Evansella clarkii]|uniref:hypothetical protein n=1 Tax=Evansella clarkii TaxID=79879 RepID=UPI001472B455|nr:hypothetical protein [Evansella clarkii]
MKKTQHIADAIIRELKSHGVIIQRYDSLSSRSIYLKLDYGVSKSVRISDHKGKKHLNYRYNIQTDIQTYRYDRQTKRFFYPADDIQGLLRQILKDREDKKIRYGNNYNVFMMQNIEANGHKNGFWADSHIV